MATIIVILWPDTILLHQTKIDHVVTQCLYVQNHLLRSKYSLIVPIVQPVSRIDVILATEATCQRVSLGVSQLTCLMTP